MPQCFNGRNNIWYFSFLSLLCEAQQAAMVRLYLCVRVPLNNVSTDGFHQITNEHRTTRLHFTQVLFVYRQYRVLRKNWKFRKKFVFNFSLILKTISVAARKFAAACFLELRVRISPGTWLSLVKDAWFQVEDSVKGRSLVQGSPTAYVCVCVSLSVIRCNNILQHRTWLCRKRSE